VPQRVTRSGVEVADGLRAWATAFPDGVVAMTNVIAVGPWVVVEWLRRALRPARYVAKPPSGRRFERRGCAVAEVAEEKIVRYRDYFDRAQMYEPLGLMHLLTG
jgi:ketosteroid isomerase-like protein